MLPSRIPHTRRWAVAPYGLVRPFRVDHTLLPALMQDTAGKPVWRLQVLRYHVDHSHPEVAHKAAAAD